MPDMPQDVSNHRAWCEAERRSAEAEIAALTKHGNVGNESRVSELKERIAAMIAAIEQVDQDYA